MTTTLAGSGLCATLLVVAVGCSSRVADARARLAAPDVSVTPASRTVPKVLDGGAEVSRAATPTAPAKLACLLRYYPGKAVFDDARWWMEVGDGERLLFDDGRPKTFEERLAAPDLEDLFAAPYPRTPIASVTSPNGDPGRVRATELLQATYGRDESEIRRQLVTVSLLGRPFSVHQRVAEPLRRVAARLDELARTDPSMKRFFEHPGGGFLFRKIAGTDRLSGHAFGIAVDLDGRYGAYHLWDRSPRWRNQVPETIVSVFESEGFIWGGRWYHYDTLHFEYRPELLDPSCRAR